MSFHSNQDPLPDAAASCVSDTTTSLYSGVSDLSGNSHSRGSRNSRSSRFTERSDSSSLRRDREREGRCADCGAQTHELVYDGEARTSRKVPLNIEGEVRRGRCLLCNPLPVRMQQPQQQQQQQQQLQEDIIDEMDSVQSGGSSHITQQCHHHPQEKGCYYSNFSASQSLEGERHNNHNRHQRQPRGGRSDWSVYSAQSYNSAPDFGFSSDQSQRSNHHETYSLGARSAPNFDRSRRAAPPPVAELSMYSSSRGERQPRRQPQHQEREDYYPDATSSNDNIANNLHNMALDEQDQDQGQARSQQGLPPSARRSAGQHHHQQQQPQHQQQQQHSQQQQQQQQQQSSSDAATINEILASMQRYPNHIPTQSKGLHSLWVLSWDRRNCDVITRSGGVPLFLDSMRRNMNTSTLISNGIAALQNLALDGPGRDAIVDADGVAAIVEAMASFVQDKAIQQSGCTALANLADGGPGQKTCVAERGGILAMMRAVDAHRGDESILRAAYQALRKLGYNPG